MTRQFVPASRTFAAGHLPSMFATLVVAAALTLWATHARAQYQWRDENGRMVYSDKAPPLSVKPEHVIRADPKRPVYVETANAKASGDGKSPAAEGKADAAHKADAGHRDGENARPGQTQADRELEQRRKFQEQVNAEKKRREQAEMEAKVSKACDEMHGEIRTLESGMRITRVTKDGEREYLSDEERASRLDTIRRSVKESCKS